MKKQLTDPRRHALDYIHEMRAQGISLAFTVQSLYDYMDLLIDKYRGGNHLERDNSCYSQPKFTALTAWAGETLARTYNGFWDGEFYGNKPGINYYTSKVVFKNYEFRPDLWIGNCFANGRGAQDEEYKTYASYLSKIVIPAIVNQPA